MSDLKRHFSSFSGRVLSSEDTDYLKFCKAFNGHFHKRPAIILFPVDEQDVVQAIRLSKTLDMQISVFNGGHSTVSSGLNNGNIALNMKEMNAISISADKNYVTVGAGCLAHEIDQATAPYGKAIPLGDCPVVGISGLTLGGGVGFISRSFGLTIDHLIEATLVTPDGSLRTCSSDENAELFKLLKGAGQGNFGVITQLRFDLVDIPKYVYGGNICWELKHAGSILQKYDQLIRSAPNALNLYCRINEEMGPMVKVYGMYCGDVDEGKSYFDQLRSWADPIFDNAQVYSYLDMQKINESTIVDSPCFIWKNGLLNGRMSSEFIETIVHIYNRRPTPFCRINFDTINGAVHENADACAFPHRSSDYIVSVMGVWFSQENRKEALQWANESMEMLQGFLSDGVYVNYADPSVADTPERYFGKMASHVTSAKNALDPESKIIGSLNPEDIEFSH